MQDIINKINSPPAINFDADYREVPLMIEADYSFPLSNQNMAVLKFARIELERFYKRIIKSNNNLRRNQRVTDKEISQLYNDFLFSNVSKLSNSVGSVR